jgi:hypothetical protein
MGTLEWVVHDRLSKSPLKMERCPSACFGRDGTSPTLVATRDRSKPRGALVESVETTPRSKTVSGRSLGSATCGQGSVSFGQGVFDQGAELFALGIHR